MTAKPQATADALDASRLDAALSTQEEDEEWRSWWTQLPDFIKPDYPLDLPPCRMPFARYVFTDVGAPRFCPDAACRRAGSCQGWRRPALLPCRPEEPLFIARRLMATTCWRPAPILSVALDRSGSVTPQGQMSAAPPQHAREDDCLPRRP